MIRYLDFFFMLGRPFSPLYGWAMQAREVLYKKGILRQHNLPVPVISVGNLTIGGSGKTPVVQYLAKMLAGQGYHPAIISRGYGGKATLKSNIVADGEKIFLSPLQSGDEPYMLAQSLPGIPVLTGIDRIHPCWSALEKFQANVLILDDGFQHLAVKRDVDIVLFDGNILLGNGRVFPGGYLREKVSALHRAQALLITGTDEHNRENARRFVHSLTIPNKNIPIYFSTIEKSVTNFPDQYSSTIQENIDAFAFCGIANPSRFQQSLDDMTIKVKGFWAFPDHVHYSQKTITKICRKAEQAGAKILITTEKDFVKLKDFKILSPLRVLTIRAKAEVNFDNFVVNSIANWRASA